MKILFVSANTEQINVPVMPYGMACVATAVELAGNDVKTLNLMTQTDAESQLQHVIRNFAPELIGISVRNIDDQTMKENRFLLPPVKSIVDACRRLSPAPIVLGGAGYSIFPESALAYLNADMGIQGEGETAMVMLVDRLKKKTDIEGIPGLYLPGKSTVSAQIPEKQLKKYEYPLPDFNLTTHPDFNPTDIWLPFQTRRGCPMDCIYCSTASIEGRILRKHSLEKAVTALKNYVDAGAKQFFIADNIFNLPRSYAMAFCDKIIEKGLNIKWQAILYPGYVDEELVKKMSRAGCVNVALGFESGSPPIIKMMNKRYTPETVRQISALLKAHNIRRMGFLLLGGPDETRNTAEESLAFANELDLETMRITMGIRIYPYTELARIAVRKKVIASDDDLLSPTFYLEKGLEDWLHATVEKYRAGRTNWIL